MQHNNPNQQLLTVTIATIDRLQALLKKTKEEKNYHPRSDRTQRMIQDTLSHLADVDERIREEDYGSSALYKSGYLEEMRDIYFELGVSAKVSAFDDEIRKETKKSIVDEMQAVKEREQVVKAREELDKTINEYTDSYAKYSETVEQTLKNIEDMDAQISRPLNATKKILLDVVVIYMQDIERRAQEQSVSPDEKQQLKLIVDGILNNIERLPETLDDAELLTNESEDLANLTSSIEEALDTEFEVDIADDLQNEAVIYAAKKVFMDLVMLMMEDLEKRATKSAVSVEEKERLEHLAQAIEFYIEKLPDTLDDERLEQEGAKFAALTERVSAILENLVPSIEQKADNQDDRLNQPEIDQLKKIFLEYEEHLIKSTVKDKNFEKRVAVGLILRKLESNPTCEDFEDLLNKQREMLVSRRYNSTAYKFAAKLVTSITTKGVGMWAKLAPVTGVEYISRADKIITQHKANSPTQLVKNP